MITFKIDIIQALKEKGYNTSRIRKEKIMSENALQALRVEPTKANINMATLNNICCALRCQPADLLECVPTDGEKIKYY